MNDETSDSVKAGQSSAEFSDEAVSLCIRVGASAGLCQELINLLGSVDTAEAFIKTCMAQGDVGLPTPQERRLLMVGDPDRRERIRKSLLAMAMISGAPAIGFGVPFPRDEIGHELGLLHGLSAGNTGKRHYLAPSPVTHRGRSLAEKKARRAKRKQRRQR